MQELEQLQEHGPASSTNTLDATLAAPEEARAEVPEEEAPLLSISTEGSHDTGSTHLHPALPLQQSVHGPLHQSVSDQLHDTHVLQANSGRTSAVDVHSWATPSPVSEHPRLQLDQQPGAAQVGNPLVAAVQALTCWRPDGQLLFDNLSFEIHQGEMKVTTPQHLASATYTMRTPLDQHLRFLLSIICMLRRLQAQR